jgi:hypothetical protein
MNVQLVLINDLPRSANTPVLQCAQELNVSAHPLSDVRVNVEEIALQQIAIEVLRLQSKFGIVKSLVRLPDCSPK